MAAEQDDYAQDGYAIYEPGAVTNLPSSLTSMFNSHPTISVGESAFITDVVVHVMFRYGMEHAGIVVNPNGWAGAIEHPGVSQVSEHIAVFLQEL